MLSGGANESEKSTAKEINDYIRTNLITPKPTGGYTGQLYATENPKTNFGPFSQTYSIAFLIMAELLFLILDTAVQKFGTMELKVPNNYIINIIDHL